VWLVREAPGVQELISEMSRIGVSAHDDWADAAADVFHPNVYYATRLMDPGTDTKQAYPVRPYDDILQPGMNAVIQPEGTEMSDALARDLYDSYARQKGETPWGEPLSPTRPPID
jgi:hypothetical protein